MLRILFLSYQVYQDVFKHIPTFRSFRMSSSLSPSKYQLGISGMPPIPSIPRMIRGFNLVSMRKQYPFRISRVQRVHLARSTHFFFLFVPSGLFVCVLVCLSVYWRLSLTWSIWSIRFNKIYVMFLMYAIISNISKVSTCIYCIYINVWSCLIHQILSHPSNPCNSSNPSSLSI